MAKGIQTFKDLEDAARNIAVLHNTSSLGYIAIAGSSHGRLQLLKELERKSDTELDTLRQHADAAVQALAPKELDDEGKKLLAIRKFARMQLNAALRHRGK